MSLSFPSYQQQPSNTPPSSARPQILHQSHVAMGRGPRNSLTSLLKLFIPTISCLFRHLPASPDAQRSPLLRALSPSINPQERPPTQRGLSHLANQLLTQASIPPASAVHLLVCMTRPAGQHLSPASRYYLPALSPTYLPAYSTHLPVGITHLPAGITHLPASITHLLPGTTHLSTGTFVPVSHLLLLLFPSITHLLANFIPCGHHTSDS